MTSTGNVKRVVILIFDESRVIQYFSSTNSSNIPDSRARYRMENQVGKLYEQNTGYIIFISFFINYFFLFSFNEEKTVLITLILSWYDEHFNPLTKQWWKFTKYLIRRHYDELTLISSYLSIESLTYSWRKRGISVSPL